MFSPANSFRNGLTLILWIAVCLFAFVNFSWAVFFLGTIYCTGMWLVLAFFQGAWRGDG